MKLKKIHNLLLLICIFIGHKSDFLAVRDGYKPMMVCERCHTGIKLN